MMMADDPEEAARRIVAAMDGPIDPAIGRDALIAGIARAPDAAAALVDLLRATETADRHDALIAESFCYAMLQGSAEHARWREATPRPAGAAAGALSIVRRGDVLDLAIDRPTTHNAIDRALRDALHEAFTLAALDRDIATVRLRGRGRCFSVGADLSEFGTTRDPATAHRIRMATLPALALLGCADRLDVHVQGGCVGAGLEMAAFAARFTARGDAWFQLPEIAMGLIPGAGGTVSVPRRIGRRRAEQWMLSGRRIGARTALAWGLIDAIVDDPAGDDRHLDESGG